MPAHFCETCGQPLTDGYVMTSRQAATFLGVHRDTIRKLSNEGRLPHIVTSGGHRRFRRSDLEDYANKVAT